MDQTWGSKLLLVTTSEGEVIQFLSDCNLCSSGWTLLCSLLLNLLRAVQTVSSAERNGSSHHHHTWAPQSFFFPLFFFSPIDISHHAHTACISIHNLRGGGHWGEGGKSENEKEDSRVQGYSGALSRAGSFNSPLAQT